MASLAGIISQHGKIDTDSSTEIGKMLNLMRHRGPDNSLVRSLTDARGALGVNEINLSPDRTYCSSLEETPYILFDGKLFNERPGGQNDISLFREYYEKYERNCFKYLDGSFSCAIIEKDDYGYFAFVPSLKGCVSQGDTMEEALRNIKEAIELYIETLNPDEITSLARQDYLIAPVEINIAHV